MDKTTFAKFKFEFGVSCSAGPASDGEVSIIRSYFHFWSTEMLKLNNNAVLYQI